MLTITTNEREPALEMSGEVSLLRHVRSVRRRNAGSTLPSNHALHLP